jgi:hypothetical protein
MLEGRLALAAMQDRKVQAGSVTTVVHSSSNSGVNMPALLADI